MPNKAMEALIRRPKQRYGLASNGEGRAKFVLVEPDVSGDVNVAAEQPQRVVDGSADGGKGREEPPQPAAMNELIRELAFGAYARKMRQGG